MTTTTRGVQLGVAASLAALQLALMPLSASAATYLSPFTPAEIATWTADRTFPSGGVASLPTFEGRTNVLSMSIDKDNRSTNGSFYYTEGIQKQGEFGTTLGIDMFVDADWENIDVRSGLWGVAADENDVITAYPIIEFSTKRSDDSTGWRYWNGAGWVNVATAYTYDAWATLTIDITDSAIEFMINGEAIGSMPLDGTTQFNTVILNAYNYGETGAGYATHWHPGIPNPAVKADCLNGGFVTYGFSNQGQCVRFVETGKDSR